VLAALVHALFAAQLIFHMATTPADDAATHLLLGIYAAMLLYGYVVSAALAFVGLLRRGLLAYGWVLLLTPIYWLLLSLAAWRALFQLLLDPYSWEKTEHGLARTSRLASYPQR
jgi:hypothetical protein